MADFLANTPATRPSGIRSPASAMWLARVLLLMLAVLQWGVFIKTGKLEHRVIGVLTLTGSILAFFWRMHPRKQLNLLIFLGLLGFANFAVHLASAPEPFALRLLQVGIIFGYGFLILAGLGSLVSGRSAIALLVSSVLLALGLTAFEAKSVPDPKRVQVLSSVMRWEGGTVPDPVLGQINAPKTTARSLFTSNPRGYFKPADPRPLQWQLGSNHPGSAARLIFPRSPNFDGVRVEIDRSEVLTPWHVQTTFGGLELRKGDRYNLSFRVRADRPRPFSYGVSQAHPPWDNLGWYDKIDIVNGWLEVTEVFRANTSENQARFTFDIGDDVSAVEIQGVSVRHFDTGSNIVRSPPVEYSVDYRFNDHGCRGPDRASVKSATTRRILVLGDSFAMGVGVHEEDTFTSQLQALLNAGTAPATASEYEVINCGVSGYSIKQERQLLEVLGPDYFPDIVIVAVVPIFDGSVRANFKDESFHDPSKYERLFHSWGRIQPRRHPVRKPPPDYSDSLRELFAMRKSAAALHARLVVFAFRNQPLSYGWVPLVETFSTGLAGTDIPFVDIGNGLVTDENWHELFVHPDGVIHPNEIVHRAAAKQVAELLRKHDLLK